MQNEIISQTESEAPEAKGIFLPALLDTTNFKTPGYIGLAVGVPIFGLGVWQVMTGRRRLSDPKSHPIAAGLAAYGSPEDVAYKIDSEMQSGGAKIGSVTVTPSWLVSSSTYGLRVLALEEVVWVYKKVTQHRTNFIPTHKTFAAIVCTKQGAVHEFSCSQQEVELLLTCIHSKVPWILVGFDAQLAALWQADKSAVAAAVTERRNQPAPPSVETLPQPGPLA